MIAERRHGLAHRHLLGGIEMDKHRVAVRIHRLLHRRIAQHLLHVRQLRFHCADLAAPIVEGGEQFIVRPGRRRVRAHLFDEVDRPGDVLAQQAEENPQRHQVALRLAQALREYVGDRGRVLPHLLAEHAGEFLVALPRLGEQRGLERREHADDDQQRDQHAAYQDPGRPVDRLRADRPDGHGMRRARCQIADRSQNDRHAIPPESRAIWLTETDGPHSHDSPVSKRRCFNP